MFLKGNPNRKKSYIYEISSDYKFNAKTVNNVTFSLYLKGAIKLILPRKYSKMFSRRFLNLDFDLLIDLITTRIITCTIVF